jgi:site-specific DNA recombinase
MQDKRSVPAVLYAAKSTEDKHGSIPDQLARGRALAEREGWLIAGEFKDESFSAYSRNRGPDLEKAKAKAIALAERHGEAVLVALHSDRVARGAGDEPGAADHLVEVVAQLRRNGVRLRTVEDDFFADDRIGLLMAAVMGQRNTEDSRRKAESVQAGMKRRAERGEFSGPRPYGYVYAANGSGLVPHPPEAEIVRRVFAEYVAGRSLSAIARGLHDDGIPTQRGSLWRQSTVSGIVRNSVYVGRLTYRGAALPATHEPIIDADAWNRAAQLVASKPTKRGRPPKEKRHLFTGGFLRCGNCGEAMVPRTRPRSAYEFYECHGRKLFNCPTGAIRRADIDTAVLAHFESIALDVDATRQALAAALDRRTAEAQALLQAAEHEAQEAVDRLTRVKRDYTSGELTAAEWRELRAELAPEAEAAAAEAERLRVQAAEAAEAGSIKDAEAVVLEQLAEIRAAVAGNVEQPANTDGLRAVLRRLFSRFTLHTNPPREAHVELIDSGFWIEPIVNEQAIAGYDENMQPVLRREPLVQAANNYRDGSPSR